MSDNITLDPVDVLGAIQRRTVDMAQYLQRPPMAIDCGAIQGQLYAISQLVGSLQQMQQQVEGAQNGEAQPAPN